MTFRRTAIAASTFVVALAFASAAGAPNNINLVFNGLAVSNGSARPATEAFEGWGGDGCFPTTHQPVYDPATRQQKGTISVWGKNFAFGTGGSLFISEFIVFELAQGEVHVASGTNGTCGAPIDPALKPPLYQNLGTLVVIAGGGDGTIVGGTGKYADWTAAGGRPAPVGADLSLRVAALVMNPEACEIRPRF